MAKSKKRKTKTRKAKRAARKPVKKTKRAAKKSAAKKVSKKTAKTAAPAKSKTYKILIMGAAYGSLLASKMLFGGHSIHHVCLPAEADLINAEGFRVRLPVR